MSLGGDTDVLDSPLSTKFETTACPGIFSQLLIAHNQVQDIFSKLGLMRRLILVSAG